ncbi:MAG: alpha/beta hydrolase [Candidatus Levybacteria bacterium]|nr:alpha/beta hydrolase [Candidatus Levybacteria bacterium]
MKFEVYILPGWAYSIEKWEPFVRLLKQKGVEVNLLKIPGLTEKLDKVWNVNDYVEWLRKKTNNKIILIGHSNGGRIALNFVAKYPNLVPNLVLIDSAGIYHDDLAIRLKRLIFKSIAKTAKKITNTQKLKDFLYKIVGENDYRNATQNMKQTMLNLINSDKLLSFGNITTPTLIIWGKNDKITRLSDAKLINKLIKNSTLHIIDGARHSPQFTNPVEVVNTIVKEINNKTI